MTQPTLSLNIKKKPPPPPPRQGQLDVYQIPNPKAGRHSTPITFFCNLTQSLPICSPPPPPLSNQTGQFLFCFQPSTTRTTKGCQCTILLLDRPWVGVGGGWVGMVRIIHPPTLSEADTIQQHGVPVAWPAQWGQPNCPTSGSNVTPPPPPQGVPVGWPGGPGPGTPPPQTPQPTHRTKVPGHVSGVASAIWTIRMAHTDTALCCYRQKILPPPPHQLTARLTSQRSARVFQHTRMAHTPVLS